LERAQLVVFSAAGAIGRSLIGTANARQHQPERQEREDPIELVSGDGGNDVPGSCRILGH